MLRAALTPLQSTWIFLSSDKIGKLKTLFSSKPLQLAKNTPAIFEAYMMMQYMDMYMQQRCSAPDFQDHTTLHFSCLPGRAALCNISYVN